MFFWFMLLMVGAVALITTLIFGFYRIHAKRTELKDQFRAQVQSMEYQKQAQQVRNDQAVIEQRNVEERAQRTLARNKQDRALAIIRKAITSFERAITNINNVEGRLGDLCTNAFGARITLYPDLVRQADFIYENASKNLPEVYHIAEQLTACRRIEQDLIEVMGSNFDPEQTLLKAAEEMMIAGKRAHINAYTTREDLDQLERDLKAQQPIWVGNPTPPTASSTLQDGMGKLRSARIVKEYRPTGTGPSTFRFLFPEHYKREQGR